LKKRRGRAATRIITTVRPGSESKTGPSWLRSGTRNLEDREEALYIADMGTGLRGPVGKCGKDDGQKDIRGKTGEGK